MSDEPECTCTELEQLTVCHDMRNEPHVVGCPRWRMRRNGIAPAQGGDVLDDLWWEAGR